MIQPLRHRDRGSEKQQRLAALGPGTKQELRNQRRACERSRGAGHAREVTIPHSHLLTAPSSREDVSKHKGGSPLSQSCLEIIKGHSQSCFYAFKVNAVLLKGGLGWADGHTLLLLGTGRAQVKGLQPPLHIPCLAPVSQEGTSVQLYLGH